MKPDIIYFDHDANARRDPKMISLISDFGADGYGKFWMLIEYLREQQGSIELTKNNYRAIAFELRCDTQEAENFINTLTELGLLRYDDGFIFSDRLNKNIDHLNTVREKRKTAAKARWEKMNQSDTVNANASETDANALESECKSNAIAPENDAKKRKEKNSIEKKRREEKNSFAPALADVVNFFLGQNQNAEEANKFFNHYQGIGWVKSGTEITDWKAAGLSWIDKINNFSNGKNGASESKYVTYAYLLDKKEKGDRDILKRYEAVDMLDRTGKKLWKLIENGENNEDLPLPDTKAS